ncbi:MAG TPA: IS110 family transposase [Spirochaetia bacterium]|nr:IS110 family transposase [Spirochaetia bacterium]
MDVIHRNCCGLDVHKETISACHLYMLEDGSVKKNQEKFGTMTRDLLRLADWMKEKGTTHVAMESTGVYWKPIWNILEGLFDVLLVNAKHIKQVPGRKTDMKDCEWIAQLLQHGLLPRSFVPPKTIRELRDLTRHRAKIIQQKASIANRIQKTLEDANIKLACVATDILGVSGREMLESMIKGENNPDVLAECAKRKLRGKIPELKLALEGKITEHHRFMLEIAFQQLKDLEDLIKRIDAKIEEHMHPFEKAVSLLKTIPGIDQKNAEAIVAEIGTDMNQFPSEAHLASWAGICPGNNESAGKKKSGKTPKGNHWLRRVLGEAGWAASRSKNTYLSAQYKRLMPRRGKKRAIVAVGHTILTICYWMLKKNMEYKELGVEYFIRLDPEKHKKYHVKKLEMLGFEVILQPQTK